MTVTALISKLLRRRNTFRCFGCKKTALHSHRTLAQLQKGKTKFLCQNCCDSAIFVSAPNAGGGDGFASGSSG
jgi:hypothetical protein